MRYGNTREWVAGLKVVTGSGELVELGRALVKNSSGYDLRQLMIASEGTLGMIVEATLKLTDPPPPSNVMLLALPSFDALMQVFATFRARLQLQAFEFLTDVALRHVLAHGAQPPFAELHPYYVVTEFASDDASEAEALAAFEQCMEQGLVSDGVISASDAQAAQLWRLREGITESLAKYVPVSYTHLDVYKRQQHTHATHWATPTGGEERLEVGVFGGRHRDEDKCG